MNQHSPRKATGSLLERAAEIYDFNAVLRGKETQASPVIPTDNQVQGRLNGPDTGMPAQPIDRDVLRGLGFILPDSLSAAFQRSYASSSGHCCWAQQASTARNFRAANAFWFARRIRARPRTSAL